MAEDHTGQSFGTNEIKFGRRQPFVKRADTQNQTEGSHRRIIDVATNHINRYLGVNTIPPYLAILNNEGPKAQTDENDGKKSIVLRPHIFDKEGGDVPNVLVHEVAHTIEDTFLDLDPDRDTDTAIYLSEGFADFLSADDPTGIRVALRLVKLPGTYERIRAAEDTDFGERMIEHLSLNKLFAVRQSEPFERGAQYWVGGALVRFIVEKGGLQALREIMRNVQVYKQYSLEWSQSEGATLEELQKEENRVRESLKGAIQNQFGDVGKFEMEWKNTVLGKTDQSSS